MKSILKELNYTYTHDEIAKIINMINGIRIERAKSDDNTRLPVSRTTALVGLDELDRNIGKTLQSLGLNWDALRGDLGLDQKINPQTINDVDIADDFGGALQSYSNSLDTNPHANLRTIATAIVQSATNQKLKGNFSDRISRHLNEDVDLEKLIQEFSSSFSQQVEIGANSDAPSNRDDFPQTENGESKQSEETPPGQQTVVARDATTDQLVGDIKSHATALAKLFRGAEGEFCFALFGRWGVGKTELAKLVAELLSNGKDGFEERGAVANDRVKYEIVKFSAWQYPRPPETWIYLYEAFADASRGTDWPDLFKSQATALRIGLGKHGVMYIVLALLSFATAAHPKVLPGQTTDLFSTILPLIPGFASLFFLYRNGRMSVGDLSKRYAQLTTHREKLGLQATIGDDFKALVNAWIPKPPTKASSSGKKNGTKKRNGIEFQWNIFFIFLGMIFVSYALNPWGSLQFIASPSPISHSSYLDAGWLTPTRASPADFAVETESKAPKYLELVEEKPNWAFDLGWKIHDAAEGQLTPQSVRYVLFWTWTVLSAATLVWLWHSIAMFPNRYAKILLIIDDLDRCNPGDLLRTIEGLKLLLEEKEIQERVQVLMLIDDRMLKYAIANKFTGFLHSSAVKEDVRSNERQRLVAEHLQKLFLGEMTLQQPNSKVLQEIALQHLNSHGPRAENNGLETVEGEPEGSDAKVSDEPEIFSQTASGNEPGGVTSDILKNSQTNDQNIKKIRDNRDNNSPESKYAYGDLEIIILKEIIGNIPKEHLWTARNVRIYLFKYQLAKSLHISVYNNEPDHQKLADHIMKAMTDGRPVSKGNEQTPLEAITEMIVGSWWITDDRSSIKN